MRIYRDRRDGGRVLAEHLAGYAGRSDVLVLALPRGGVPVAYEVARALGAPLDILLVRKLGVPGYAELAMGAIASGGVRVLNHGVVSALRIPDSVVDQVAAQEQRELERRERLYRGNRPAVDVRGKTVILVDDGLATGASMRAAISALKQRGPAAVIVAVPTAPASTCAELQPLVDGCVCVDLPEWFFAVGESYAEFPQVSDAEVTALLEQAGALAGRHA